MTVLSGMVRAKAAVFAAALLLATSAAGQLAPQKSSQRGVTVAVTPAELSDKAWTFKIVLDTHAEDLSDDVAMIVTLTDGRGMEIRPVAWEGAAPGGHHREGVLKFDAIAPRPQVIELRMNRPGESTPRLFRWELK